MAQHTGKLMWGQAGEYDAVDDRQVIGATIQGVPGVWIPPTLAAGPGLGVRVGPFTGAVACGDGTIAVAASHDEIILTQTGGGSLDRTDEIWLAGDPDNAAWTLDFEPTANTAALLGISLGSVTVPAGANQASQFTFAPQINSLGYIRNFRNNAERRAVLGQLIRGKAWGAITTLESGSLPFTGDIGPHIDIGNGAFGRWELMYVAQSPGIVGHPPEPMPGFVQGGGLSVTTNSFGDATVAFPIRYANADNIGFSANGVNPSAVPPAVQVNPNITIRGLYVYGAEIRILRADTNAPYGNASIYLSWMARGVVTTDTFP